jgi:hypothetical protein
LLQVLREAEPAVDLRRDENGHGRNAATAGSVASTKRSTRAGRTTSRYSPPAPIVQPAVIVADAERRLRRGEERPVPSDEAHGRTATRANAHMEVDDASSSRLYGRSSWRVVDEETARRGKRERQSARAPRETQLAAQQRGGDQRQDAEGNGRRRIRSSPSPKTRITALSRE